jgi:hypothetical protein
LSLIAHAPGKPGPMRRKTGRNSLKDFQQEKPPDIWSAFPCVTPTMVSA